MLTEAEAENAQQAAYRAAHSRGHTLGTRAREQARPGRIGAERALSLTETALHQWGFEPFRATPTRVRLRNCPFHPFPANAPSLVCGINHAFLTGFLTGLDTSQVEAVLEPRPGECCVALHTANGTRS